MLSQLTEVVNRIVPVHEQAMRERCSSYSEQLWFIERRLKVATSGLNDTMTPPVPPMQEFDDIISAVCDVHMMLTHLVGIQMTRQIPLRRHAEELENKAFQTVIHLARLALTVDERAKSLKKISQLDYLLEDVSMILFRGGVKSEPVEQRKRLLEYMSPNSDELTQTLGKLSIEHIKMEEDTAMDLM
ncbi:hypothetical protein BDR22DRAFT_890399 [Usnea florida]